MCRGHLRYRVRDASSGKHKVVLKGISGRVVPGEMCALVGPSGAGDLSYRADAAAPAALAEYDCAGKSTLLDILAGRKGKAGIEGQVAFSLSTSKWLAAHLS